MNDGTSSTAASQFGNNPVPGDPNNPPVTLSNYATGHRVNLTASYTRPLFAGVDTTISLFYNGQIPNESHVGQAPYRGGAALEMDWKGRILWEVNHPDHNHDGVRLKNGNVLLICQKLLPADIVAKVRGGRLGSEYDNGKMDAPYLVEMTTNGHVVWEWLSWDHLDPEQDAITAVPAQAWQIAVDHPSRMIGTSGRSLIASRRCPSETCS